jgi:hypothetical protein
MIWNKARGIDELARNGRACDNDFRIILVFQTLTMRKAGKRERSVASVRQETKKEARLRSHMRTGRHRDGGFRGNLNAFLDRVRSKSPVEP